MLDAVVAAVVSMLRGAGLNALKAYPAALLNKETGPVVCVRVVNGKLSGSGYAEYLGIRRDPDTQNTAELYGLRLELTLGLDVYAPMEGGAEAAGGLFSEIGRALMALPAGLKNVALTCGETAPDPVTEMFRTPVELSCRAYLICRADEETGEFYDFVLRGAIKNGN